MAGFWDVQRILLLALVFVVVIGRAYVVLDTYTSLFLILCCVLTPKRDLDNQC